MEKMRPKTITEKTNLHPRNKDRFGYDFNELIQILPELENNEAINSHDSSTNGLMNQYKNWKKQA